LRRAIAHVDDRERRDQRLGRELLHGGAGLGEMDRRIEMRAGVLDDAPPVEIEAVLLEIELLLQLDAGHTEERGEVRRHGVGEIDHALEPARRRGGLRLRDGGGGEACGRGALEEPTTAERGMHRLLASRYAHGRPPAISAWPLASLCDNQLARRFYEQSVGCQ